MIATYLKIFFVFFLISHRSFAQRAIDRNEIVNIGGIKQYIRMKGKDESKPILLFLHGGPGGSLLNKMDDMTGKLQEHFVVVHWDQRETGETLRLNKSTQPLTLNLFYNDTHELIDTLLKKFRKSKLYLTGYSWGSGLGFHIAEKYPELLHAYIAVSPVIDPRRSDSISLAMLKSKMGKKARKELSPVKIPFENPDQLYYHRKWLLAHEGQKFLTLALPRRFFESWANTWFDVWSKSNNVNLFQSLQTIGCPVYFFAGEKDYNTNAAITTEYFNKVAAPKKDLFLFADAGHGLPETHAGSFQDFIIKKILPETINRGGAAR